MRPVCFLFLLLPAIAGAQQTHRNETDSLRIYERQISQMHRNMYDSLRKTDRFKKASERIQYFRSKSDGYAAFTLFMDIAQADFEEFNASIKQSGFEDLHGPAYRFGFGFSIKTNRTIVDFFLLAAGLKKESGKFTGTPAQSGVISADFFSGALLDIGYDLIRNNRINFYPYAGLSIRTCDLSFNGPTSTNPAFTNITNIIINKQIAEGSSIRLGYQAGIGFDLVTSKSNKPGGGIIFLKAGINKPFGKDIYKIEGIRYDPGIEYGNWILTIGLKFFGRK